MDTVKGIFTKEKIDRQLLGQSSSTPFMNIQEDYSSYKKVFSFDTLGTLDDKIDKLTSVMNISTGQDNSQNRPIKPTIYQGKRKGQTRNYYNQDRYQDRYTSNSGDRRMSYRGRAQYRQNYRERSQYDQNYRGDFRRGNFRGMQNYRGQNFRGGYRGSFSNDNLGRGRSISRER